LFWGPLGDILEPAELDSTVEGCDGGKDVELFTRGKMGSKTRD
jgi:hypothetical protein